MKKQIQRRAALFAAAFLFGAAALATWQTTTYAEETAAAGTEAADEDVSAVPVLVVEGNTIYVDASADSAWNTIQGTVKFDPSVEVEKYGLVEDFAEDVVEQNLMGVPAQNVTDDGEFIFAAAYMSTSGGGVEYTGHIFYITFKDTSTPIDITLYDEYDYELLTATVDGEEDAVVYAPESAVVDENGEKHEEDAAAYAAGTSTGADADTNTDAESGTDGETASGTSSRSVVPIIVVLVIVALAVVTIVIAKKNGKDETSHKQ